MEAAKKAAELALRYQPNIVAETKPDQVSRDSGGSRMRAVDRAHAERGVSRRRHFGRRRARARRRRSGRRWIIDPIDGTRDYVRGNPLWANLIALEAEGDVVVGMVNLPVLGKLYTASRGEGRFATARAFTLPPKHPSRNLFCA